MIQERAAGASTLPDRTVAQDLLKDCKFCVMSFAQAITEATDPQVRQFLSNSLKEVTQEQRRISDIMVSKDWYTPYDTSRQIQADVMTSRLLETQVGQSH